MTVTRRLLALALVLSVALILVACAAEEEPPADEVPDGSAGLRLAPGLYDLEDGTVQAIGTLEWVDLEGGFWAVTGATGENPEPTTLAVIANGNELADTLEPLAGKQVSVLGRRLDGASIRMAGPEIEADRIEELSDTPGIAE